LNMTTVSDDHVHRLPCTSARSRRSCSSIFSV
jgi:hypothetical protein